MNKWVKTEIKPHNGAPALWIDGKPVFPLLLMTTANGLRELQALGFEGTHLGFLVAAGIASPDGLSLDRMRDLLQMPLHFTSESPPHPSLPPALRDARQGVAESERTWYAPQPPVAAGTLRRLLQQSGAHVYTDQDDNLMVGCGYLALHAASTGKKTLHLPSPARWTDLRNGSVVVACSDCIEVQATIGQTLLYAIDPI